jgi:hypothetical protein
VELVAVVVLVAVQADTEFLRPPISRQRQIIL